ncbi:MAG: glycoside hydrolase family 127 protein, partial [Verrucomicrobia bacterium]|nr:glycoside hydrolase family 127 protein [Verrucomicrobiota bacterium]
GLDATVAVAQNILATEINAAGSGAAFECWYHGGARETEPAFHMMETCVTTTWLRLCESLLRVTGDPRYADQIERTLYNAFLASLAADGSTFSKYCPLEGMRGRGEDQCRMTTNCCIANGPRGFVALLDTLVMADTDTVLVNLYADSRATIALPGAGPAVTVEQKTDYPVGDTVRLTVSPARAAAFTLKLRIPAWSATTTVTLNGLPVAGAKPGTYLPIARTWQAGDTVELKLDLRGRGRIKDNHLVIERGPIVLTRDARLGPDNIHDVVHAPDLAQPIKLTPVAPRSPAIWMAFTAELRLGLNLETEEGKKPRSVSFCDFASAGNTWHEDSLYRVWQRLPLNVMKAPYVPYNPPN